MEHESHLGRLRAPDEWHAWFVGAFELLVHDAPALRECAVRSLPLAVEARTDECLDDAAVGFKGTQEPHVASRGPAERRGPVNVHHAVGESDARIEAEAGAASLLGALLQQCRQAPVCVRDRELIRVDAAHENVRSFALCGCLRRSRPRNRVVVRSSLPPESGVPHVLDAWSGRGDDLPKMRRVEGAIVVDEDAAHAEMEMPSEPEGEAVGFVLDYDSHPDL